MARCGSQGQARETGGHSGKYGPLPVSASECVTPQKPLRIAIVTPEIVGPSHGGVGTAYHGLARILADHGNDVTILYIPLETPRMDRFRTWKDSYAKLGITLELLSEPFPRTLNSLWSNAKRSYQVLQWLLSNPPFDVVHFPDGKALGFYPIVAKHQGLFFTRTNFVVGAHSTTFWDAAFSFGEKTYYQDYLERTYMESACARLSDFLISPSRFHLEWMEHQLGWTLSEHSYVQPNIMSATFPSLAAGTPENSDGSQKKAISELVFFGRLERRKGLSLFCDALDHPAIRGRTDFSVSFMGHVAYIDGTPVSEYLRGRSRRWSFSWTIIPRLERDQALAYLKTPGRMAVIPSLSETMSYTVLECLWAGIPFVATRVGGIPELIHGSDLDRVTVEPSPMGLAQKILLALEKGWAPAHPSFDINESGQRWVNWHHSLSLSQPPPPESMGSPTISVCIATDPLIHPIDRDFLDSLHSQDYADFDVIFVHLGEGPSVGEAKKPKDKNAPAPEETPKVTHLAVDQGGLVAALNLAASRATGEFLLFLEPGTCLKTTGITSLSHVVQKTKADIVSFATEHWGEGRDRSERGGLEGEIQMHLGNAFSLGALHNVFGGSSFLVKREVFKQLNGFRENLLEDYVWDFYARASLNSYSIESLPLPLARVSRRPKSDGRIGAFVYEHPYLEQVPDKFRDLFHSLQATRFFHDPSPDGTFESGFVNRPQVFVDEYWNSKLWRLFLKAGNPVRRSVGLPALSPPRVRTLTESIRAVGQVQDSVFWNVFSPFLRGLRRLRRSLRRN